MSGAEIQERLDEALRLCEAGAYAEAERIYHVLIEADPEAADAWNMLGVVLYQQGNLSEAAEASARATQLRPAIAPYWLMRGNVALALGQHSLAQESFSRAVEIAPAFAEAHYRLGVSLHGDARCADAAAAYRKALQYAPDVAEIHWQLAEALIALGQRNEALRAYQEAFSRDPDGALDRRRCFEWLGRLHFDSLPQWWHRELEHFCERENVDKQPYVRAGLNALKTKPAFRGALARSAAADTPLELDVALREVLQDRLFGALLRDCLMPDVGFERFLTRLRAQLLLSSKARSQAPFEFLCALALQNLNNEFVHAQSERETDEAAALASQVELALQSSAPLTDEVLRSLLLVACYRRLNELGGIDRLVASDAASVALRRLLERSVTHVRIERSLRADIASIGGTNDPVSRAVRGMYEEHPYPRWFALDREPPLTLAAWISRELPAMPGLATPQSAHILVAGCGTGRDALWLASNIANAQVLGIDLSLSSLAYGRRMGAALGVDNIEFRQGDILALPGIGQRFDMIASTGVLHHMHDPFAGLTSITALLRPGGFMRLGFYSARARVSVTAARRIIAAEGISPTESEIRNFRQRVFESSRDSPLKELEHASDFYSMSMCRDLLFHVQEHQYTLPQIGAMLDAVDLEFLGLAELSPDTVFGYRRMFPADRQMTDIAGWDAYEAEDPDTFSNMFLLWCRSAPH